MVLALPVITNETTQRKEGNSTITLSELPIAEKIEQFCRESMILQELFLDPRSSELDATAQLLQESEESQETATLSFISQKTGQCFRSIVVITRPYPHVHPLKNYAMSVEKQVKPEPSLVSLSQKKVIEKEIIYSEKKTHCSKESAFRQILESSQKYPLFTIIQKVVYHSLFSKIEAKKDIPETPSSFQKEHQNSTLNKEIYSSVKQQETLSSLPHQKWYQDRREGDKGNSDQQQQEKDASQKEKQLLKVKRKLSSSFSTQTTPLKEEMQETATSSFFQKHAFSQKETKHAGFPQNYAGAPLLAPPEIGIYSLCWILSKLGIVTSNRSQYYLQQEIRDLDTDINKSQSERIQKMSRDAALKKSTRPWSIMTKVMSWIGSFMSLITGIALIATGTGVVAGAMLITSGALSMTNHLLEATGGWTKIAAKLGKENPTKTKTMIMWMQLSIALVSFILGGAAVVIGGFNTIKEVLGQAGTLFVAVASTGIGVLLIAKGIMDKKMHNNQSTMKSIDRTLAQYGNDRENNLENSQDILQAIERFYEQLLEILRLTWADARRVALMR